MFVAQRYLRTLDEPYLRSQWQKAKEDLSGEFRIVKEICLELAKFREPAGRASASAARGERNSRTPPLNVHTV